MRYHADGTVAAYDGPGRVVRQRGWPGAMGFPQSVILTPHTEMSMKFMVEISRGCPCMCRFCWAGYNYLPVRGFTRAELVARAREVRSVTGKIGLVSTAVCDHPEIDGIVDDLAAMDYEVSVASLRLDDLTPQFVFKLADTGVQGLTLAPECGSDRMRRIINKQFTNAEILDKATWIFENGIQNLKLYYMVGLPFEEHADVEAIVELTDQIRERMLAVARGRGRIGRIHPSVNPFVPKPGTPYQWLPMEDPKESDRKLQFLRKAFSRMPNVDAVIKSARTGTAQSILALGDRRVASALEIAARERMDFKRATREAGLDAFLLPLPAPGEGRDPAVGRPRQRCREVVLLEGARAQRGGAAVPPLPGDPGLHPLRRLPRDPEPVLRAAREVEGPGDPALLRAHAGALKTRPGRLPHGSLGAIAPVALVGGPVRLVGRPLGVERHALEGAARAEPAQARHHADERVLRRFHPAPVHEAVGLVGRHAHRAPGPRSRTRRAPRPPTGRPSARIAGRATGSAAPCRRP